MANFCAECGAQLATGGKFCGSCGKVVAHICPTCGQNWDPPISAPKVKKSAVVSTPSVPATPAPSVIPATKPSAKTLSNSRVQPIYGSQYVDGKDCPNCGSKGMANKTCTTCESEN